MTPLVSHDEDNEDALSQKTEEGDDVNDCFADIGVIENQGGGLFHRMSPMQKKYSV